MYKTKNIQKPKNYWQMLIKEVTAGNHRPCGPQTYLCAK